MCLFLGVVFMTSCANDMEQIYEDYSMGNINHVSESTTSGGQTRKWIYVDGKWKHVDVLSEIED